MIQPFKGRSEVNQLLGENADMFQTWDWIPGQGNGSDLMLVKLAVNQFEKSGRKPFLGMDGTSIRRGILKNFSIGCYWTSLVPFTSPVVKQILKSHARACWPVWEKELRAVNPRSILFFGSKLFSCLPPEFRANQRTFSSAMGKVLEGTNGYRFAFIPDTWVIAKNPLMYELFLETVGKLISYPEKEEFSIDRGYVLAETPLQARRLIESLPEIAAMDLETTGLDMSDDILMISFSGEPGTGFVVPWKFFSPEQWGMLLAGRKWVFTNGSFDCRILASHGVYVSIYRDVRLMHSQLDHRREFHSLEQMAYRYLNRTKLTELAPPEKMAKGVRGMPMAEFDYPDAELHWEDVGRYSIRDADLTLQLHRVFSPYVESRPINDTLHRATNVLVLAGVKGIRIDMDKAFALDEEVKKAIHDKLIYINDTYGLENPGSSKQVSDYLYNKLGLPVKRYQGRVTTKDDFIAQWADDYPVIRDVLEYRHLRKVSGTYLKRLVECDGRYHPDFKLAVTETGRVAESFILLIPRAEQGQDLDAGERYRARLRELFIPDPGMVMIGADYSALEVRMAAYLSRDQQLIDDINSDLDMHSVNAIKAFNLDVPLQPLSTLKKRVVEKYERQRVMAKFATFTYLYGGTAETIALQLRIPLATARALLDALKSRYPQLAEWQESVKEYVRVSGSYTTLWGRTRRFLFSAGMNKESELNQLREAINYPIQSTSSDLNLEAFTRVAEAGYDVLFPLHDAVYLQVPEEDVDTAKAKVKEIMENVLHGPVRFEVDIKHGMSWAEL